MASYLKASIKRSYAESFLTELERNENQYFFFIGRGTPWTIETSPPVYTDSVRSEYDVMNGIIGYKKLNPQNTIFALPRYEWESGTVYDQYQDNVNLFDDSDPKIFYVVTDQNHIYKCLSNGSGAQSTVKPNLVISAPFSTSDGYRWQYLSTVKEGDLPYELTDYIPVDFATVSTDTETQNQFNAQISAVNASITRVGVSNAAGASAGNYKNTIIPSDSSPVALLVSAYNSTTNAVTVSDADSRAKIVASGINILDYVGYMMRINYSTANAAEIGNYALIDAVSVGANETVFTLKNDVVPFALTPSGAGKICSVEILPFVKIVGNGNGAYFVPTVSTSATGNKFISSLSVVDGGQDYSNISAEVVSPKTATTVHPTLTITLSPKGGHGSNILKELNVQNILIIIKITEEDAEKIVVGGSYRQFGIIKNPVLADGTRAIAGSDDLYYRDISLINPDGFPIPSDFDYTDAGLVIGTESYSAAKIIGVKSLNSDTITLKTKNTSGRFITKQDRINDYTVNLTTIPGAPFQTGELVQQIVPAGFRLGSGVSYGYSYTVTGKVISSSDAAIGVRLVSSENFVAGSGVTFTGLVSGATGYPSTISPNYGERVWITRGSGSSAEFLNISSLGASSQTLYRVVDSGIPYFELDQTPAYSGLHVLEVATSISSATGGMDTTFSSLSQNSFSNGDFIIQGSTGSYGHYASGKVYYWSFVNGSYGKLYLTDVLGKFKSVATDGITGSNIGAYIVSSVIEPEIDRTSGEILYIDNVRPIQRNTAQEEEFRLRLGF